MIKTCRADTESCNAATSRQRRRDTGDDLSKRASWFIGANSPRQGKPQLTDPVRRPELPRAPIAREFMEHNPHEQVELCGEVLLKYLCSSRRGAAAGPSGMTGEHLRVILDSESDSDAFTAFACTLAVGEVPHENRRPPGWDTTALRKPDGGVRGIVVGDFLSIGCPHIGPTILQDSSGGHSPVPVCSLNESRNRGRDPRTRCKD